MELDGDVRVVPSSKRVTEDRWALVGLMRPLLARFGGCGVASSNFRRVSRNSFRSSSRSARSCLNSSSRGAEAPAPIFLLWLAGCLACSECCPFGVRVWDPCPSEGCVVADARCSMQSALELAVGQGRPDQGGDAEGRLAPRDALAKGCATAWVSNNLNRTRTQNACVAIESGFVLP